ncbi:hypothetical protein GALMADRAFT_233332, partial [Galerina marginata CBS 339.88]
MPNIRFSIFAYPLFHASVQKSRSSPHEISHHYVYTRPVCDVGIKRYYDPIQTTFWLDETARRATGQHRMRRPSFDIFESQGRTIYSADRKGQSSLPTHDCYLPDSQESISTHSAPHVKLYQKSAVLRRRHRSFGEPLRWEKNRRTHHSSHPLRKPEGVWAKNLCKTKEEEVSLITITGQDTPNPFEVDANTPKGWEMDDGWSRPPTLALTGPCHPILRGLNQTLVFLL